MASYFNKILSFSLRGKFLKGAYDPVVQCVRFRKPIHLPIAKSKEFYVRKPTPIVPEEYDMLNARYIEYRAGVESVRRFLKQKMSEKDVNLTAKQFTDDVNDFLLMEEQVKEWNKYVAIQREARQTEEIRQEEERIQQLINQRAEKRLQDSIDAEKKLKRNKEVSANFITAISRDKLEDEIEKMLDSRSDYNFAITKTGEILKGEYPDKAHLQKHGHST
ncbi:unnamed protein product [Lymnaea stagnalis]|uniref:Small ribosomal subunit protein mS26 n=1 Tax=Lymnaea stagnalis TaxID=6523 RepID=A0AAV2IBT8_LYMST